MVWRSTALALLWASVPTTVACTLGHDEPSLGSGESPGADTSGQGSTSAPDEPPEDSSTCEPTIAPSPLRRLTRAQLTNTIRDLLGDHGDVMSALVADDRVGAFFANTETAVTQVHVDQYRYVARELARRAIADIDQLAPCGKPIANPTACARGFIQSFGRRTYRRPPTTEQLEALLAVFEVGHSYAGYDGGIALVLEAMLQSPSLLYLVETGASEAGPYGHALDGYELAARLSYLLWNTTPDDALLDAAEAGELDEVDALIEHATRMLDDPRARETIASFHMQWLGIDDLAPDSKAPELGVTDDAELVATMRDEAIAFADWIVREHAGTLTDLLTTPVAVTDDARLLALYGIESDDHGEPDVPLDPQQRAGLLTRVAFLSRHAHAHETSPIHRGKAIRERVLCTELPAPPPGVDATPPESSDAKTTRERYEQHLTDPSCRACHHLIDGLGFAFETYDAIGRYRTHEGEHPIDATGTLADTGDAPVDFDDAVALSYALAQGETAHRCLTRQWFRYAFARYEADADACTLTTIDETFALGDRPIRELILALVRTPAFRHTAGPR